MSMNNCNIPFTIVKSTEQSSNEDEEYRWTTKRQFGLSETQVSFLKLNQTPHEILEMKVTFYKVETTQDRIQRDGEGKLEVVSTSKNSSNRPTIPYYFEYSIELNFANNLHEFNQGYEYEVVCKFGISNEYLFGWVGPRLGKSISSGAHYVVSKCNLLENNGSDFEFYIRRLNSDTTIGDGTMHAVISTLRGIGCDVALKAKDGQLIGSHRSILSQNSEVFQKMFSVEMKEEQSGIVNMSDFEAKVVQKMLDYLYTKQLDELGDMKESLFKLAHRYQLHDLCRRCEEYYIFKVGVDNDSIVEMLKLANTYNLKHLNECAINFVNSHEEKLIKFSRYQKYLIQTLNVDNVVATLVLADKYGVKVVERETFKFIKDNYLQMMKKPDFVELFVSKGQLMKEIHLYVFK